MDIVSSVVYKNRLVEIEINYEQKIIITKSMYKKYPLNENQEIDLKEYLLNIKDIQYKSALNKALSLLAKTAKTKLEIQRSLSKFCFPQDIIDEVIALLEKEKYLNDKLYASSFIASKMAAGIGKLKLQQDLLKKGINKSLIDECLQELNYEDTALESAKTLAQKYIARFKDIGYKEKTKIYAALLRKGFNSSIAKQAVEELCN